MKEDKYEKRTIILHQLIDNNPSLRTDLRYKFLFNYCCFLVTYVISLIVYKDNRLVAKNKPIEHGITTVLENHSQVLEQVDILFTYKQLNERKKK